MLFITSGVERITGYKASDFIQNKNLSFDDIYHPEDRDRIFEEVSYALKAHKSYTIEYRVKHKAGHYIYLWEQGIGIYENNEVIALEGYITDITLQKMTEIDLMEKVNQQASELLRQREDEIERANFLRTLELTKAMAHEFKNPLTLTLNSCNIMKTEIGRDPINRQRIEMLISIMKNANLRINDIVETIDLTFRSLSNKRGLFHIRELIDKSLNEELRQEIEKENIRINIDQGIIQYLLEITGQNFIQSLRNILRNSIKAIRDSEKKSQGVITINVDEAEDETLHLEIYDNGVGISKECMDIITIPFYSTSTSNTSGGLGLATAKFLFQHDNIGIAFESEKDEWTKVILIIPKSRWRQNGNN